MMTDFEMEISKLERRLANVEETQGRLRQEKEQIRENISRLTSCREAEKMVSWLEETPGKIACHRCRDFENFQIVYLHIDRFDNDGNVIEDFPYPFPHDGAFYVEGNPDMWVLDDWPENVPHPLLHGKPQEVQFITYHPKQSQFSMPADISARVVALCEKHLIDP
jgi:hypothetical protein